MPLEQYWSVVRRWWWLIVASVLVATLSSYLSLSRAPRIYQASTTVMVGQALLDPNPSGQDFAISQQLAQTYVNMVPRQPILQGAAQALNLPYVPYRGNVSARIVPGTELVEISVRDTSPERARALADEIAQQLVLQTPTGSEEDRTRRAFVEGQLWNLERNIEETEAEIEEEQARLDAANSARAIQQYQSNITALQTKLSSYRATYASMLQTVQGATNSIRVIEPATTPTRPISPRVMETVLLAAAIGLALALGGAFAIEFLDDTIKTPQDVARATGLPTLGTVARIEGKTDADRLVARRDPQSPLAEAFRALRASLQSLAHGQTLHTLLITSPDPVEGKSTLVANLAVTMAQAGHSVVVIDTDLRRPMQHVLFGVKNDRGLSNAVLALEGDLGSYAQRVACRDLTSEQGNGSARAPLRQSIEVGDLHVITSGPPTLSPADLVGSEHLGFLIDQLGDRAGVVLLDSPPVLAATDALLLAMRVDGVLLLNDAGHTRRSRAQQAVERLRQVQAPLLGVVLNRVSPRREDDDVYDYYYAHRENGQHSREQRRPGHERPAPAWRRLFARQPRSRPYGPARRRPGLLSRWRYGLNALRYRLRGTGTKDSESFSELRQRYAWLLDLPEKPEQGQAVHERGEEQTEP